MTNKILIFMFHDLHTYKYGLNISPPESESFIVMFERLDSNLAGGELTMENAKALRDFLNDLLDGKV